MQWFWSPPCLFNLYSENVMWNARLDEEQAGIKTARRNINNLRYADDTTLMTYSFPNFEPIFCHSYGRKWRETKELLDEGGREEWKSWLKTQHSKSQDHGIQSHHFMANRWGNNENSGRLFSWAPKSLHKVTAAMKLKDTCPLEGKLWQT